MKVDELETWELHSCILEVDLEYPKSLHDLHNDYPLAPEQGSKTYTQFRK